MTRRRSLAHGEVGYLESRAGIEVNAFEVVLFLVDGVHEFIHASEHLWMQLEDRLIWVVNRERTGVAHLSESISDE